MVLPRGWGAVEDAGAAVVGGQQHGVGGGGWGGGGSGGGGGGCGGGRIGGRPCRASLSACPARPDPGPWAVGAAGCARRWRAHGLPPGSRRSGRCGMSPIFAAGQSGRAPRCCPCRGPPLQKPLPACAAPSVGSNRSRGLSIRPSRWQPVPCPPLTRRGRPRPAGAGRRQAIGGGWSGGGRGGGRAWGFLSGGGGGGGGVSDWRRLVRRGAVRVSRMVFSFGWRAHHCLRGRTVMVPVMPDW